ncbi:MAG: diaminopimelate decarboxylase [Candidatus Puniceispirillaceae bacterium]
MTEIHRNSAGELMISGTPAAALAAEFGTPLYVYSGDGFAAHYRAFCAALSSLDTNVHYAVKANSALGILGLLAQHGAGADIVSGGEMQKCLAAGIPAERIVFSGVGKSDTEIRQALEAGIGQINAESAAELHHISAIASEMGVTAPVALRVNVNVDPGSHAKISTGQRSTKFGIPVADGEAASLYRQMASDTAIRPAGLAVHIGSQLTDLAPFEKAYLELLELADSLRDEGFEVPVLDLGGGLGIDYHGEQLPDFAAYGALVTRIFSNRGYQLGFEPGRAIAADNGLLLTRTHYIKQGQDKRFIIVDGAMNDLIRPTLYEAYHRIEPVVDKGPGRGMADIVGPVCETGDYLGQGRDMPDIGEGDLLAVFSAGAYGAVMMSTYNTRPEAAEVMIYQGKVHLLRRRRTIEELLAAEENPFA